MRLQVRGLPPLVSATSTPGGARWAGGVVAALVVVGLVLRILHLGTGLWFDEIQTLVDYVRSPLGTIVTYYDNTNQHLFYSVLARISTQLLGESGAALRLPAALLGTASLLAFYLLAIRVTDRVEALLGTALLTFSYHHVWFSQNARGYSGLLLFTLLATAAFLRLLSEREAGWGAAVAYGISAALGAYLHPLAILIPLAHGLVLAALWWRVRRTAPRAGWRPAAGILVAGILTLVLYAPVLSQVVATLTGSNPYGAETAWKSPLWLLKETLSVLGTGLPGGWVSVLAAGVVAITGLASYGRQSVAVAALMVLPGMLTAAVILALNHNLWPRFFFFSAGFAILIAIRGGFVIGRAVFRQRGNTLATVGAVLVIVASAFTVPRAWRPKQDFEGARDFVERTRAPGDAVVTVSLTTYPYSQWLGRDWAGLENLEQLRAVERTHPRTWVLYTFPIRLRTTLPAIWERLTAAYDTAAVYPGTIGGGDIVVMKLRSAPPAP
jgi:mannosyltransferase